MARREERSAVLLGRWQYPSGTEIRGTRPKGGKVRTSAKDGGMVRSSGWSCLGRKCFYAKHVIEFVEGMSDDPSWTDGFFGGPFVLTLASSVQRPQPSNRPTRTIAGDACM
jgi:hypothetical protein